MKRYWVTVAVIGTAVLALFAHLYWESAGVSFSEYAQYERGLERLKQLDSGFNADVLKARSHLLNNYDGFTEQLREASDTVTSLRDMPTFVTGEGRTRLGVALTNYIGLLEEKQRAIEDFKTHNSVVRNSLTYFPSAGSELVRKAAAAPDGRELQLSFEELMRLLFVHSLTANDELGPQIQEAVLRVRAWADANPNHSDADLVLGLVSHARALLSRKPKVDALTSRLVSLPTSADLNVMVYTYQSEFARALRKTHGYRLALFLCSLVLLAGIAWTIRALRLSNLYLENRVIDRTAELSSKNAQLETEIVQRERTEIALRDNEERFRTLSTCAPSGVLETDATGQCLYVNPCGQSLLGLTLEESMGHGWRKALHPDDAVSVLKAWEAAVADGTSFRHEFRLQTSTGEVRWVQFQSAAKRDDQGVSGHVGMFVDITERKKAEEERQRMEVQLRHAQKLESIGQLAAGIAHEINTPTQYIGDNARFLKDAFSDLINVFHPLEKIVAQETPLEGSKELITELRVATARADLDYLATEIPKALGQSLDGVERVSNIVRAMKEFSHPGTTEKTALDLNRAIESTLTVCCSEWKYVADVVTEFDTSLPPVPVLPGEFNQAILNIIINATHAIADVVGDGANGKGKITVSTRRDGDWVEVRLGDTGTGIPEHARSKVFDPFFTTKGVGKGTGQGLAIAYSVVVEKHGGTIHFETETGKGTTFIVRLPLAAPAARIERKAA